MFHELHCTTSSMVGAITLHTQPRSLWQFVVHPFPEITSPLDFTILEGYEGGATPISTTFVQI